MKKESWGAIGDFTLVYIYLLFIFFLTDSILYAIFDLNYPSWVVYSGTMIAYFLYPKLFGHSVAQKLKREGWL